MFGKPKKLKRISYDTVSYIQIETEAIRDFNDKQMISSYCLHKLELVNWYIELIRAGSEKYIVPQSIQELESIYFACCTVILAGVEYIILHHITYFTGEKIERMISVFFYTGIASLILKLCTSLIFKEDYYAGIGLFRGVYGIIIFCLNIGVILLPLSIVIMLVKYRKIIKFFKSIF